MLTSRRSATGPDPSGRARGVATPGPTGVPTAAVPPSASLDPHSPQNRAPGVFGEPQDGHVAASREPHSWQNLRPASLAVPHAGQCMGGMYRARVSDCRLVNR